MRVWGQGARGGSVIPCPGHPPMRILCPGSELGTWGPVRKLSRQSSGARHTAQSPERRPGCAAHMPAGRPWEQTWARSVLGSKVRADVRL